MAKKKWRYVKTGPLSGHWVYGSSEEDLDNKADTVQQVDINRGVAPEDSSKGFLGSIFSNIGEAFLGEGFSELNLGESLKSWLDSMSGAEMTNAQKQQNEFEANQAQINRDFQSKEAELAFERQVEFYDEYQSIGAQMRQYRENGLNPALLAGGVSPSASGGSSPAAQGSNAYSTALSNNPMALVSFVMQMLGKKAQIDNIKADTDLKQSTSNKTDKETSWIDRLNSQNIKQSEQIISESRSNCQLNTQKVNESAQSVQESIKRMDVMDSTITLNGSLVNLNLSQAQLNMVKSKVENLNAQTIEKILPYVEARQEAEIALTTAKTEEAKFAAEQNMYEANLRMLKGLVEADLIDSGYYDNVIAESGWSVKQAKRNYHWQPINNLCTCFRDVSIGVSALSNASTNSKSESRKSNNDSWVSEAVSEGLPYILEGM